MDRRAVVPNPGSQWAVVVDALLDGPDIVVVGAGVAAGGPVSPPTARSLISRARNRSGMVMRGRQRTCAYSPPVTGMAAWAMVTVTSSSAKST
jgi:hypothetical protein